MQECKLGGRNCARGKNEGSIRRSGVSNSTGCFPASGVEKRPVKSAQKNVWREARANVKKLQWPRLGSVDGRKSGKKNEEGPPLKISVRGISGRKRLNPRHL